MRQKIYSVLRRDKDRPPSINICSHALWLFVVIWPFFPPFSSLSPSLCSFWLSCQVVALLGPAQTQPQLQPQSAVRLSTLLPILCLIIRALKPQLNVLLYLGFLWSTTIKYRNCIYALWLMAHSRCPIG